MNKHTKTLGIAVGMSVLMAGCASSPEQNDKVDEARSNYEMVENDPNVARSGASQLRSARNELERAESLLQEGADIDRVEHVAYLANRHAQIAAEQGERAELQEQIDSAEDRREQLMLQMRSSEAEKARQEAEELRRQMEEMEAEQTDRGMVLTLGDVLFDLNEADLRSDGEDTVRQLAEFMREYEDRRVRVEGYTDSTGAASYNQQLSERRAESVRDALTGMGISQDRVETRGYGEEYPKASNDSREGRQQNRRVEIVISDADGNIESR